MSSVNCTQCAQWCKFMKFYWTRHLIPKVKIKNTTYIPKDLHGMHNECSVPGPPPKERNSTCFIIMLNKLALASHISPFLPPSHLVRRRLETCTCFSSPSTHHSPSPLYSNITYLKYDSWVDCKCKDLHLAIFFKADLGSQTLGNL